MVCEHTLRIKNLPVDFSDAEKKDFMRHFGAAQVKIFNSKSKQRSVVYAKFQSADIAKAVLQRLHQLLVLNSRLCVEYAENDIGDSLPKIKTKESLESSNKRHFKTFVNRLNAFNSSVFFNQPPPSHLKYIYPKPNRATINNIAHALASIPKFYTQVLHLMNRMNLPPPFSDVPDPAPKHQVTSTPNQTTAMVPGQTTQQLINSHMLQPGQLSSGQPTTSHLISPLTSRQIPSQLPPNQTQAVASRQIQVGQLTSSHLLSGQQTLNPEQQITLQISGQHLNFPIHTSEKKAETSESEIESENEGDEKLMEVIPAKRKQPQRKIIKRPKFIKLQPSQPANPTKNPEKAENVFEKVEITQQKKIELKVAPDALEQKTKAELKSFEAIGTFGLIEPVESKQPKSKEENKTEDEQNKTEDKQNKSEDNQSKHEEKQNKTDVEPNTVITEEELAANRLELKDLNVLPVFKNYHPGAPTCRLYIKNIAKTVETKDLDFIFKRYYTESKDPEVPSQFDIRLMQEGRMKGQAFITLDSIELAQKALKETNGYILKDRPMVVVFARSAAPTK